MQQDLTVIVVLHAFAKFVSNKSDMIALVQFKLGSARSFCRGNKTGENADQQRGGQSLHWGPQRECWLW